jgi:hypothetical protein
MEIGRIVKPEALSVVDVLGVNANNFALRVTTTVVT